MGLVNQIDEASLPPKELRRGNHYWRINSTEKAGYVLVVSDQLPMCHITGGGGTDLKPAIEAVIASPNFVKHWKAGADLSARKSVVWGKGEDVGGGMGVRRNIKK